MAKFTIKPVLTSQRAYAFGDALKRGKDVVRLGRSAEAGQTIDISFDVSGEFVIGIFGKRGSGKSYSLGSFVESLCTFPTETSIGKCSHTRAVLLLDTLNIFWTTGQPLTPADRTQFPEEWKKLSLWGIEPSATAVSVWVPRGFSTSVTPKDYKELSLPPSALSVEDWADLIEIDLFSDRLGQLLFDVYTKVSTDGWNDSTQSWPASEHFSIDDLLTCLAQDADIQTYYNPETIRALSQRLRAVSALTFFATTGGTNLCDLLIPGQLSVVLLNRLPDTLRSVLASVLMRRILAERSEASELNKQLKLNRKLSADETSAIQSRLSQLIPSTIVALDEAQNILPSERGTKATETIIKYVREGRNHGLSFVFTTQQPSAIDARILAQVDTIIGHKLTIAADVKRFEDNLKSRNPDVVQLTGRTLSFVDWLRSLSQGQAIVSNTEEDRNFVVDVRPRICPHGGQGVV